MCPICYDWNIYRGLKSERIWILENFTTAARSEYAVQRVIRLSGKSGRSPPPGSNSASSIDKRSCGTPNSVSAGTVRRHCRPLLSRMRASVLPSLLEPLPSLGPPLCSSRPLLHKTNGVGAGGECIRFAQSTRITRNALISGTLSYAASIRQSTIFRRVILFFMIIIFFAKETKYRININFVSKNHFKIDAGRLKFYEYNLIIVFEKPVRKPVERGNKNAGRAMQTSYTYRVI